MYHPAEDHPAAMAAPDNDFDILRLAVEAGGAIKPFVDRVVASAVDGPASRTLRKRAFTKLYMLPNTETPYGPLMIRFEVVGTRGTMKLAMLNTFTFFVHACHISRRFFDFMSELIQRHRVLTIALYTDGVTPRNKLRPDQAGAFEAIRFTICQFPHWVHIRQGLRWIPLCYPTKDNMEECGVTLSQLVAAILLAWFPDDSFSWETGVVLRHEGCPPVHLRLEFGPMPQDADAFKYVYSLKGSSGRSPCPWCSNCMGRLPYFEDLSGFCHIHSPVYSKFTHHTNETFFMMVDDLENFADDADELAEREIVYGLNYEPLNLIFNRQVRRHLRMPCSIYWDHMHCLTASGGIAQFLINQLCLRICAALVMLPADLDIFHRNILGMSRVRKDFFRTRIVDNQTAHFRGFASDCLAAFSIIGLFILLVMPAGGVLDGEILCFWHMFRILKILQRARMADIPRLEWEILQHHLLFMQFFPLCLRPKLHYLYHVPECWREWQILLSCYGAEADHRLPCRTFRFAINDPSRTALAHHIQSLFAAVGQENTYREYFLIAPVRPCDERLTLGGRNCRITGTSQKLQTTLAIFSKSDCLVWQHGGARHCGIALFFAEVSVAMDVGDRELYVCVVRLFRELADGWWHDCNIHQIVAATAIDWSVPYVVDGVRMMPLILNC